MRREEIQQRVMTAIQPQLDRCDELLDYYTEGLPREVWEPIAFEAAAHHGKQTFVRIAANFGDLIERINSTVRKMAQVSQHPAFHDPHEPVPPVPAQTLTRH